MLLVTKLTVRKLSSQVRVLLLLASFACVALLVVARGLEPDVRGFGTHQQLELAPCLFYQWMEKPCPMCGATTAWAYTVRGDLLQAVRANLAGTLLCGVVAMGAVWMLISAAVGRWVFCSPRLLPLLAWATVWLGIALLDWGYRVWLR